MVMLASGPEIAPMLLFDEAVLTLSVGKELDSLMTEEILETLIPIQ